MGLDQMLQPTRSDVLSMAVQAARDLLALKTERKKVSRELREFVGRRDGWICCVCGKLVDPGLNTTPAPNRARAAELDDELSHLTEIRDVPGVVTWVGGDLERAAAAHRWFNRTWGAHVPPRTTPVEREQYRSQIKPHSRVLYAAIGPLIGELEQRVTMRASAEHVVPVVLGGATDAANLRIAHQKCNVNPTGEAKRILAAPVHARALLRALDEPRDSRPVVHHDVVHHFEFVAAALRAAGRHTDELDHVAANLGAAPADEVPGPHRALQPGAAA